MGKNPFSYFLNLRAVFDTKRLGVWWCVWVSGGVSAHRSLRIYGSPRRTIILICPPECVFGPPEYGESVGPQQSPEYAGGPKNVPILVVLRNSCGWVTKISKKMVFLSRNSTVREKMGQLRSTTTKDVRSSKTKMLLESCPRTYMAMILNSAWELDLPAATASRTVTEHFEGTYVLAFSKHDGVY